MKTKLLTVALMLALTGCATSQHSKENTISLNVEAFNLSLDRNQGVKFDGCKVSELVADSTVGVCELYLSQYLYTELNKNGSDKNLFNIMNGLGESSHKTVISYTGEGKEPIVGIIKRESDYIKKIKQKEDGNVEIEMGKLSYNSTNSFKAIPISPTQMVVTYENETIQPIKPSKVGNEKEVSYQPTNIMMTESKQTLLVNKGQNNFLKIEKIGNEKFQILTFKIE